MSDIEGLLDMPPNEIMHYAVNGPLANAVFGTKGFLRDLLGGQTKAYLTHIGFCQLVQTLLLTMYHAVPTLAHLVSHVVQVSAQEQVVRPNARWIIAMVKYVQTFWNWAVVHFPTQSVGKDMTSAAIKSTPNTQASIPAASSGSSPQPASLSLFDVAPESLREMRYSDAGSGRPRTCQAAVFAPSTTDIRLKSHECPTALKTGSFNWWQGGIRCGTMGMHDNLQRCCAVPLAVSAVQGHLCALIIPYNTQHAQLAAWSRSA